ncbi:MAG: hypothetical protein P3C10_04480 [Gemmatimonadota bacterium]|nr:hypothetical protein [Gemmatimonadota bacterium]
MLVLVVLAASVLVRELAANLARFPVTAVWPLRLAELAAAGSSPGHSPQPRVR